MNQEGRDDRDYWESKYDIPDPGFYYCPFHDEDHFTDDNDCDTEEEE